MHRPTKGELNTQIKSLNKAIDASPLKVIANNAQEQFVSKEGTKLLNIDDIDTGIKAVSQALESKEVQSSLNLVTGVLQDVVNGVDIKREVENKSDLSTMIGEQLSNGLNDAVVLSANPEGLNEALKNIPNLNKKFPPHIRKKAIKSLSVLPSKVEEIIDINVPSKVFSSATKVLGNKMNAIGKPLGNLLKETIDQGTIGPAGFSFGNILPNAYSKAVGGKIMKNIGDIISVPSSMTEQILPLVNELANTDFVNNFSAADLTPDTINPTTKKTNITQIQNSFKGYNTPSDYEFVIIDKTQLIRRLTNPAREFTTLVVEWTDPLIGPPQSLNATKIHEITNRWANTSLTPGVISANALELGIQPHFLILADGSLQLGRPIDEERYPGLKKFSKRGVELMFVANRDRPVNSQQLNTFHEFLSVWFSVYPGNPVIENYRVDTNSSGPGFDVTTYVNSKFNKKDLYSLTDIGTLTDALTPEEITALDLQAQEAKPSKANEEAGKTADTLKVATVAKSATTGEIETYSAADIEAAKLERQAAIDKIKLYTSDKSGLVNEARLIAKNSTRYNTIQILMADADKKIEDQTAIILAKDVIISRPQQGAQ